MTQQAQAVKRRARVLESPTAEHEARRAGRVGAIPAAARRRDARVDLPTRGGRPLPESLRRPLEVRLGHDLRTVRVHTGRDAAVASRALGAGAYAYGRDVGFAPGRFDPASTRGSRLLEHEVAHVVQQSRTPGPPVVQLQPAEETAPVAHSRLVPRASLSVSLSGLSFNSYAYYEPGPKRPQAIAMVLARLLGDEYRQGLEQRVLAAIEAENMTFTGDWANPAAVAGDKEVIGRIGLNAPAALALIDILRGMELEPELSEQQHHILRMAWYTEHAWKDVQRIGPETAELPAWYYEYRYLFNRAMASQGELLAAYGLTVEAEKEGEASAAERRADAARDLILAIAGAVDVLEQVRINGELRRDKTVAPLVAVLWVIPDDGSEPTELADVTKAAAFLGFVWSQPKLMEDRAHTEAQKEMLWRFARFYVRELSVEGGDEPLLPKPSTVNASPWPAQLIPKPQLSPPLYEAPQEWGLDTRMSIEFPTVFAAFAARFDFYWERLRVPTKGEGAKPGTTPTKEQAVETVSGLYGSEKSVHEEIDALIEALGPPGTAAPTLNAATVIARALGQRGPDYFVHRTGGDNSSDWSFKFASPGIFVVRCTARQRRDSDAEYQRAPSVAYIPIFVRPASVMVEEQARALVEERTRDQELIPEIDAMLSAPLLPPDVQKELLQLREDLAASQEGAGAMLKLQEQRLAKQWDEIKDSNTVSEREKRDLKRRLEEVRLILETRAERIADQPALGGAGRLLATFIADGGQSLPLLMEVADLPSTVDAPYRVYVSDLTLSKSGESSGEGKTRAEAIEDAVTQILEGTQGYDTGWVAFVVDDVPIKKRIGKSKGKLLAEAIDKASIFLTIAAILAAPFTGGASLWLLIPVAIATAGTSLYRILQRSEAHVLRADLETLLDIVNIIGGVVAPIRVAASGLRLMRLGRTMMVLGLGNDGAGIILMGAAIAQQLDAVKDLPWDERGPAIQVILGQALFQVGLMAGGELAQIGIRRRAMLKSLDPKRRPAAPKNPRRTGAPDPAAKDRTMAGINQEPKGTTVLPRKGRQRRTRPGHDDPLLAALEKEGVRREPPPPYKVTEPIKDHMTLKERFNDYESAYAAYDAVLAVAGGREVAICRNQKTGEYAVQIGSTTSVGKPSGGKWRTLLHFHPNKENVLRFRLPAPQDFNELMVRFLNSKRTVREFLEYDIPGVGRGRTEFGITPGHAEPFYVKTYMPDGSVSEVRFASDGPFHAYWGRDTIFVEKGSDVYKAMMRDLDVWRSQLDRGMLDKSIAGAVTSKTEAVEPLQTDRGDLTKAGLDFLRQNVKSLRHATDDQIRAKFLTEGFAFEVLAREELRRLSAPKQTKTTFLLTKPRMKLSWVIERIRIARKQTKPKSTPPLLTEGVHEFVERTPSLRALRDEGLNSPDARIRDAWEIFYYGEKLPRGQRQPRRPARKGERLPRGFFFGRVGDKEPDALTIDLDGSVIRVIDFTQQVGVKIHNFKTLFYKLVLGEATGLGVTAVDYRSELRQREL